MAASKALSAEIVALFDTIRQQAHAYAEAFARVEELLHQLQNQREQLHAEVVSLHQQQEALIGQFRRQVEELLALLTGRAAMLQEGVARVERVEALAHHVSQLPEHFAGQVAEALAQMQQVVRGTEQKLALVIRSLQEELAHVQQRLHVVRLLCQRDIGELRQHFESMQTLFDPAQLREQVLQSLERRLQPLEHQLAELARAVVQLGKPPEELPATPPILSQEEHEAARWWRRELQLVEQKIVRLEKFVMLAFILCAALAIGMGVILVLEGGN